MSLTKRLTCGLATVGALMLVLAATAAATIVVGEGIAGVRLGDSQRQVEKLLGPAPYKSPQEYKHETSWGYSAPFEGRVGFDPQLHVNGMWTASKHQKTSKGIGPGSSYARFRAAYPSVSCQEGPFGPKSLGCVIKTRHKGRPVETLILFYTKALGVREIDIDYAQ